MAISEKKSSGTGSILLGPIPDTEELPVPLTPKMVREMDKTEDVWIPVRVSFSHFPHPAELSPSQESELDVEKVFSREESRKLLEYMVGEDFEEHSLPDRSMIERKIPCLDENAPIGFLHVFQNVGKGRKKEAISFERARKLAESLADMISEWQATRFHLWQLEAEMVRQSPVFNRPHAPEEKHFAQRFRLLLEYARQMLGVDAIGVYLMDEKGVTLKLRYGIGLPLDRFLKPARPWRKLIPDTMAMQGDIVFYDQHTSHGWLPPEEDFSTALCLPLVTGHSQFGTIWFYSDKPEFFAGEEMILHMELMADHIALDLEREAAYQNHLLTLTYEEELREASKFQKNQLPVPAIWSESWDFVGWTSATRTIQAFSEEESPNLYSRTNSHGQTKKAEKLHPEKSVSGDFYDWFLVPGQDEKIVFALGNAGMRGLAGACVASAVKAALRAHAVHDLSAGELLYRVNHTLWTQSAADGMISLCCGVIEEKKGKPTVRFASSGTLSALYFHGKDACRMLAPPGVKKQSVYVGAMPELNCRETVLRIKSGEFFVLFSDGISHDVTRQVRLQRKQELERLLLSRRGGTAEMILTFARNYVRNKVELPAGKDRSVLVIKRK